MLPRKSAVTGALASRALQPSPSWRASASRNGTALITRRKTKPLELPVTERLGAEDPEVDERLLRPAQPDEHRHDGHDRDRDEHRRGEIEPGDALEGQQHGAARDGRQEQARHIEAGALLPRLRHEDESQDEAQDAERHVDQEDPVPRRDRDDEPAHRRRDRRGEQGRPRDHRDRADQVGLGRGAQHDEASDGHHHAAGDALERPEDAQREQPVAHRAQRGERR